MLTRPVCSGTCIIVTAYIRPIIASSLFDTADAITADTTGCIVGLVVRYPCYSPIGLRCNSSSTRMGDGVGFFYSEVGFLKTEFRARCDLCEFSLLREMNGSSTGQRIRQ